MKKGIHLISLCESIENTYFWVVYVIYLKIPLTKLSLKYICALHKISAFQLCFTSRVILRSLARDWDPAPSSKCPIHSIPALAMASLLRCDPTVRHSWWGRLPQTLHQLPSKPTANRGVTAAELHSGSVTPRVLMREVLQTSPTYFLIWYENEAWMCLKHL